MDLADVMVWTGPVIDWAEEVRPNGGEGDWTRHREHVFQVHGADGAVKSGFPQRSSVCRLARIWHRNVGEFAPKCYRLDRSRVTL